MRRITLWLLATVATMVILFSYRTSTMSSSTTSMATGAGVSAGSGTSAGGSSGGSGGSAGGGSDGRTGATSYSGSVAQTRWGPVQVSITALSGRITAVSVPVYPNNNGRDQQINARALPILTQETMTAQSAAIDTVSGATVTSDGYRQSLQAAIDAAHLS